MKKFIALVTVAAFMFGTVGCSSLRSVRRDRDRDRSREEEEEDDNDSDELEIEADFGTFVINNGWILVDGQSNSSTPSPTRRWRACGRGA